MNYEHGLDIDRADYGNTNLDKNTNIILGHKANRRRHRVFTILAVDSVRTSAPQLSDTASKLQGRSSYIMT